MWPNRKPKNRRYQRGHVLEVKLRSQHVRARRVRLFAEILALGIVVPLLVFALWRGSQWALDEWVFRNPQFSIRRIDVQTDGAIPLPQIRQWAGVKEGENLLALDLPRIERDLKLVPWIREAAVERVLPDVLKIRVHEREPIAQVSRFQSRATDHEIEYKPTFLDEAGYVMPALSLPPSAAPLIDPETLPLLTGVSGAELRPGKRVELPQVHSALRLIEAFGRSPMISFADLKTVDVSSPQILLVTTHQQNEVVFGTQNPETDLGRWRAVHDYAQHVNKAIATLDLSVSNNVPARWQEAGIVIPVRPKPPKNSHARKKHV
jgi:cell division septal protein FtsQ